MNVMHEDDCKILKVKIINKINKASLEKYIPTNNL